MRKKGTKDPYIRYYKSWADHFEHDQILVGTS